MSRLRAILRSDSAFALAIIMPILLGTAMVGIVEFNLIAILVHH